MPTYTTADKRTDHLYRYLTDIKIRCRCTVIFLMSNIPYPVICTLLKHLFMFNTDYLESVYKVHKSEKMNDFLY